MNAKKVLGIMGGPDAAKLTPQIGLKMRHEGLEKFISDNAYKTIHNDVRSSAGDSISNRIAIEDATGMRRALGLSSEQSPAYGFLGSRELVPNTSLTVYPSQPGGLTPEELEAGNFLRQINPNSRALQTYGSASISLKESALKNATVSFGDTLSIWEQATKAGIKVPKVVRLDSLLTTLKLNSLAKKTKGILGNDFRMPYAEIHLPGGFGLDDVREVGVSNEFASRVPELISETLKLVSDAGYNHIGVHDIIARGNSAFRSSGAKIPTPHKYSDLFKFPVARYKSKAKQYTDTLLQKANKKFVKPIIKPFRDVKTLLLAKQYARKIGEVPHVSDLDIYSAQIQYRMFMDKMNLGKDNTVAAMGVDTHPSEIANQLGISENELDDDIFAYISGSIKNKKSTHTSSARPEVGHFSGIIRENQAPTSSYLNNYVRETTYTADDIYLSLNQKFRGKGIAQKFTTQYMELLKKAGVKKINIDAGMTDGGYAWARAGFKFTERPKELIERMEMAATVVDDSKFLDLLHRLHTAPVEDLPLPKEILKLKTNWRKYASEDQIKEAAMAMPDIRTASISKYKVNLNTKSLGELLLRGSNWKGSKDLVSPSFVERMKPMLTSAGDLGKSLLQKTKYLTNYKLPYAVKEAAGKVGSLSSLFAGKVKAIPKRVASSFMAKEGTGREWSKMVKDVFFTNYIGKDGKQMSQLYTIPKYREAKEKLGFEQLPWINHSGHPSTIREATKAMIPDIERQLAYIEAQIAVLPLMKKHWGPEWAKEILEHPRWSEWEEKGVRVQYLNNMELPRNREDESFAYLNNKFELEKTRKQNNLKGANDYLYGKGISSGGPLRFLEKIIDNINLRKQNRYESFTTEKRIKSINAVQKISPKIASILLNRTARHRTTDIIDLKNLKHPKDVEVRTGRNYGPGLYLAQSEEMSRDSFHTLGQNVYKIKSGIFSNLKTKGYISEKDMGKKMAKFYGEEHPEIEALSSVKGNQWRQFSTKLTGMKWEDDFIQQLIKEGYQGFKHGDAITNWLAGVPGSKFKIDTAIKPSILDKLISFNVSKTNRQIANNLVKNIFQDLQLKTPMKNVKVKEITKKQQKKLDMQLKERWKREYQEDLDAKNPNNDDRPEMANGGLVRRYATGGFVLPTPEQPPAQYAMGGMVHAARGGRIINGNFFGKFSDGGMVPSYLAQGGYANGGFAMGTDTVPAMLTPGEFVIKKSAVDRIGVSTLSKINGYADGGLVAGTSTDSSNSVYNNNYEINVNVRSDANPDQIARAVMTQIKQIDNANIRGINR